jgi:hypothetical protein
MLFPSVQDQVVLDYLIPTHSNPGFGVGVTYLRLIILSVVGDAPSIARRSLTDFVNLKIKPAQSFRGAHRGKVGVRVFKGVNARTFMNICGCTM